MQNRPLVIDANILIRAVFGQRVRALINDYAVDVNFYAAELNIHEAERYIEILAKKRGISSETCQEAFKATLSLVQTVATDAIVDLRDSALLRIQNKDPNDWPAIAAAMRLECPIWTEDRDFFGAGIAVWVTDTVEIFLRNKARQ
jgi:predicted nucleic acid-binding protein